MKKQDRRPLFDAREWRPIGVMDSVSYSFSICRRRECLLGKTLQHRFLNITEFPETHASARQCTEFSPNGREWRHNGVMAPADASRSKADLSSSNDDIVDHIDISARGPDRYLLDRFATWCRYPYLAEVPWRSWRKAPP